MLYIQLKSLVYQKLQPLASSLGCQFLILDSATYKNNIVALKQKFKALGVDRSHAFDLQEALEDYGYVALLKSKRNLSTSDVAAAFAKLGLKSDDVQLLFSAEAKKHPIFGALDAAIPLKKQMFFYWFPVVVENEHNQQVFEADDDRHRYVQPNTWMGIKGFMTVAELLKAIDSVFETQKDAWICFAPTKEGSTSLIPSSKIYGQINNVFEQHESDGTYCIMTLAPYKNGARSMDCSLDGMKNPPLKASQIKKMLEAIDPNRIVLVRYVDPLAFGPKTGQIVETAIDEIDIDRVYGVFLRPRIDIDPKVVG